MLLSDVEWRPVPINGGVAYWDEATNTPDGLMIYRRRAENTSAATGEYQVSHKTTLWGEYPHFLDALTAQCILYELTREIKDGTET